MNKDLTLLTNGKEIYFSDLDKDNDMEICITNNILEETVFYATKEDIISIKKHLEFILSQF